MKPFNLKDFKAGKRVFTRDGKEVKQLIHFDCNNKYPIYGCFEGNVYAWSLDGKIDLDSDGDKEDLFIQEPEMYVNVYETEGIQTAKMVFKNIEIALKASDGIKEYVGTYKLTRYEP